MFSEMPEIITSKIQILLRCGRSTRICLVEPRFAVKGKKVTIGKEPEIWTVADVYSEVSGERILAHKNARFEYLEKLQKKNPKRRKLS